MARPHTVEHRALVIEPSALAAPTLRAAGAWARDRGLRAVVLGTGDDALRAARLGVPVRVSVAPPVGAVALARPALRRALGPAIRGSTVAAMGPRAHAAAAAVGARAVDPVVSLPVAPVPLDRERLRAEWGVAPGAAVCMLVASPPRACDARVALDVVGRAAVLGRAVTLVAHPDARHAARASGWSGVAGGAWHLALDARTEDPELLVAAVDAALVMDAATPVDADAREPSAWTAWWASLGRAAFRPMVGSDAMGALVMARAGVPLVVAEGTAADRALAADPSSAPAGVTRFSARRPNLGALALHAALSAAG